jgi:hypothetical protein
MADHDPPQDPLHDPLSDPPDAAIDSASESAPETSTESTPDPTAPDDAAPEDDATEETATGDATEGDAAEGDATSEGAAPRRKAARFMPPEAMVRFVRDELLSPKRSRPYVLITTPHRSRHPIVDVRVWADRLGDVADLIVVGSGRGTRALCVAAPPRFDVFAGWIRLYRPGLHAQARSEEHPHYAITDAAAAQHAIDEIDRLLRVDAPEPGPVVLATVEKVSQDGLLLAAEGKQYRVRREGLRRHKIDLPRDAFRPGQRVDFRTRGPGRDGIEEAEFMWRGPRRLERLHGLLAVNDVVRARVVPAPPKSPLRGLHVELLPGCVAAVPLHEIPPELQARPDLALPGRVVLVRVAGMPPAPRPPELSMFELPALRQPTMQLSLFADGPLFLDDGGGTASATSAPPTVDAERQRLDEALRIARAETATVRAEFAHLRRQFDLLHDLHTRSERNVEQHEARARSQERQQRRQATRSAPRVADSPVRIVDGSDEVAVERLLVDAIQQESVVRSTIEQRREVPPLPFGLGRRFVTRVRELAELAEGSVVGACAEVVLQRAELDQARAVEPLREGGDGSQRVRSADSARAWRCVLQPGAAEALRLHWWRLPDGGIEFASVSRADDPTIPE